MNNADATQTALKNAQISARILSLMLEGMELRAAFDAVLGVGRYQAFADQLYDDLRAKAKR